MTLELPKMLDIPEKLLPIITKFNDYSYFLLEGSRAGGKTSSIARFLLYLADQLKIRLVCGRETQNSIDESVYTVFADLIREYKLPYNILSTEIRHIKTGSKINFRGFREQGKHNIKGLEGVDILWVDESQAITKETLDIIIPTIRRKNSKIFFSMNRFTEQDAVYDRFWNRPDCLHIYINYLDNKHCPQKMINEANICKELSFEDYEHIWLGKPRKDGGILLVVTKSMYDTLKGIQIHRPISKRLLTGDPACFDKETEILTNGGWKFFKDISGKEKVLSLNVKKDTAEWGAIRKMYRYKKDKMYLYENKKVNFCITGNHQLLVKKHREANWELIKYEDLPQRFQIRKVNKWTGKNKETISFEHCWINAKKRKIKYSFAMKDWAEFLGWFVSEGCVCQSKDKNYEQYNIQISQKNKKYIVEIKALLNRMGINYNFHGGAFTFINKSIGKHLLKHCKKYAKNKRAPIYIKEAKSEIIKIFLNSFCKGDGTFTKQGTKTYTSTSEGLINDLQEMLVKIGKSGKIYVHNKKGSSRFIEGRKITSTTDCYRLHELKNGRNTDIEKKKVTEIDYNDYVYCVETPNHTLMVRRKGIPMWAGNCGGDDCVAYILNENAQKLDELVLHERDTMKIAASWVALANRNGVKDYAIDIIGFKGIADRIRELAPRCNMIECIGSGKSSQPLDYLNQRAEIYMYAANEIINKRVEYFDDQRMIKQLTDIHIKPLNSRKLKIEHKDDIRKRILCSPDFADAYTQGIWALQFCRPWRKSEVEEEEVEALNWQAA